MSQTPRLLVTAGPSREYFDDVRFLSNASSGRMGLAVANAAARRDWRVHLALGPVAAALARDIDPGVEVHSFENARELSAICSELWSRVDAFVAAAAVCDYRPEHRHIGKKKKEPGNWDMTLVRNPDVLAERAREKEGRVLIGFALEDRPDRTEAQRKLTSKKLDVILLNTLQNLGTDSGHYLWMESAGREEELAGISKCDLGERIVDYVESSWMSSS